MEWSKKVMEEEGLGLKYPGYVECVKAYAPEYKRYQETNIRMRRVRQRARQEGAELSHIVHFSRI